MKAVGKRENETVDQLIKRFRRKVSKAGILDACREKEYNMKPSEKRHQKHREHLKRMEKHNKRMSHF